MSSTKRKGWWRWLRWPLALGVLGWLIVPNLEALRQLVEQGIRWPWLGAALLLRLGSLVITGVRWKLLLRSQGIHPAPGRVAHIVGVGYVCNFVLPGTVGGDVAKAGLIAADTPERRKRALATVPLDRGLGLLSLLMLGAIAGLLGWNAIPSQLLRSAVGVMCVISGVGVAALALVMFKAVPAASDADSSAGNLLQKIIRQVLRAVAVVQRARGAVIASLALSLIGHVGLCSASYSCLRAFRAADLPITWSDQLWLVPAAEVPAAFLALPGGLGAREGALSIFYREFAADPTTAELYAGVGVLVGGSFSLVSIALAALVGVALAVSSSVREKSPDGLAESTT